MKLSFCFPKLLVLVVRRSDKGTGFLFGHLLSLVGHEVRGFRCKSRWRAVHHDFLQWVGTFALASLLSAFRLRLLLLVGRLGEIAVVGGLSDGGILCLL